MSTFKSDLDKSDLSLKVEGLATDCKTLYCDWTLYKHCLYNLVINAIKYSRQGGQIMITLYVGQDNCLMTKISNTCEKKLNRKNFILINKELSGETFHVE
jgi:signal transduction histidine kinase